MNSANTLEMVITQIGNDWIAIEASQIRSVHPLPQADTTSSAQAENTAQRNSVPLGDVLGLKHPLFVAQKRLVPAPELGLKDLLITNELRIQTIDINNLHPLPPAITAGTFLNGFVGLLLDHNELIFVFDLSKISPTS